MLIALLSDIHANREALVACLAHAREHAVDRYVFLGDIVGYGADPGFAVDTVMDHAERGAIAVLGNHDDAAIGTSDHMNDDASLAIAWTRRQLAAPQRAFLARLPLAVEDAGRLYVHASAAMPRTWDYITDAAAAARSLRATRAQTTFCGHVHVPALFHMAVTGKVGRLDPGQGAAVGLTSERRWVAVIGAVGQPRDRNPAACYAIYDDARATLTMMRVPYDVEAAARKILDAGLPPFLGMRLAWGY